MISKNPMKIAIASGKGGTGKTTLATNLAAYLAEQKEVVLVDLDVEEPNSGLF
jgi:MinD superfamily P-loop ATPase